MPAVAVTSAQGAYAYIVALKGFSVGCQPNFKSERNWKNFLRERRPTGSPSELVFFQLASTILLRQQKWIWGEL